jgi:hypothetical protein
VGVSNFHFKVRSSFACAAMTVIYISRETFAAERFQLFLLSGQLVLLLKNRPGPIDDGYTAKTIT